MRASLRVLIGGWLAFAITYAVSRHPPGRTGITAGHPCSDHRHSSSLPQSSLPDVSPFLILAQMVHLRANLNEQV